MEVATAPETTFLSTRSGKVRNLPQLAPPNVSKQ